MCIRDSPYAVAVSENIVWACREKNVFYQRLLRSSISIDEKEDNIIFADSVEEAAEFLKTKSGNLLGTTGSKELDVYKRQAGD